MTGSPPITGEAFFALVTRDRGYGPLFKLKLACVIDFYSQVDILKRSKKFKKEPLCDIEIS